MSACAIWFASIQRLRNYYPWADSNVHQLTEAILTSKYVVGTGVLPAPLRTFSGICDHRVVPSAHFATHLRHLRSAVTETTSGSADSGSPDSGSATAATATAERR